MKFAHLADVHIGGWREPKLSILPLQALTKAFDEIIQEQVDFVLIAGDLFNTSLPSIDYIKGTTLQLMRLKNAGIPVYFVPGSHDFSPSGKTMLDVLEYAGLLVNVVKAKKLEDQRIRLQFTVDQKTGAKITGMLGKKLMLERSYYEALDNSSLIAEQGFKIFIFHSALNELKPEELSTMDSCPLSLLPKGFNYYAGGHVHIVRHSSLPGYLNIVYPGPLFPNSFSELEKLLHGGYFLYEDGSVIYKKIELKPVHSISLDCSSMDSDSVKKNLAPISTVTDKIVLLRLYGKLKGKLSEIDLNSFLKTLYDAGAYAVLKNTSGLLASDFTQLKKAYSENAEEEIIKEHLGQMELDLLPADEHHLITALLKVLSKEKSEGESSTTFEERIWSESKQLLD